MEEKLRHSQGSINCEYDNERYMHTTEEMYNMEIRKDEERNSDNYDLINSTAIGNYCREIGHQFNTEELAVLIYRNKKIDIDEKIAKYKDLINNYSDMEVIERINCKHYDSVKTMIKNEIDRLTTLKNKLQEKEENVVYSYEMHYTSTRGWDTQWNALDTLKTSFKDIDQEVEAYIKEYNDTLAYKISKRYLTSKEPTIIAEYQVINKKRILTNIYDSENDFLDIDNIFLNIPTPFKKGDLLVSWCYTPYRKGLSVENTDIFVLDYLCTWREDLDKYLAKGNYDSSDMVGYGYHMYDDIDEFMRDQKWNYDSFEYYEGELTGKYRTLKAISSFIKNKIGLELFIHAYEEFKAENRCSLLDCYNEEELKLVGCSEFDILKYRDDYGKKIYNMSENEKINYIKYQTDGFDNIDEKDIKQVEANINNYVYVLLNNGDLYECGKKIDSDIDRLYMFDGMHLYKITKDNKIIPLKELYRWNDWDNTDKYLNNNNCSYKKIVTSTLHIVALAKNGEVRAIHALPTGLGIMPENFKDVEDIIIQEIDDIETPYIFKNKEYNSLYIN